MADTPSGFDYHRYIASREWAVLREKVRERSGNTCEHCFHRPQQAVHHLTYVRIGNEDINDLMAVCNLCHEWFSGKGDNPNNAWSMVSPAYVLGKGTEAEITLHFLVPFATDTNFEPVRKFDCQGIGCTWCNETDPDWSIFLNRLVLLPEDAIWRIDGGSVR
jgi:hypothetical protein